MKKILIFGVSGFVGEYLSNLFLEKNFAVIGADIIKNEKLSDKVIFEECNLLDAENVEDIVNRHCPDFVVNLAAISSVGLSWSIPQKTVSINVIGTLNILEAVRKNCINSKILLIGSSEEYAQADEPISEEYELNANNPYGISKMMQEKFADMYVNRYNMKIVCVRAFNHTGLGQNENFVIPSFCRQAAEISKSGKEGTIYVGNLSAERDFSDVRDIVRAYYMILTSDIDSGVYNVGSGVSHTISELLEYICSLANVNINIEVSPERYREVDTPIICCDNSRIKKELAWEPCFTVFDAINGIFNEFMLY